MLNKDNFQNIGLVVGYPFNLYCSDFSETFPLHWHHYIEVILSGQEGVRHEVNGFVYTLAPNDILFIWPGELHATVHQPQPAHVLMLQFDYSVIGDRVDFRDKLYLYHRLHLIRAAENPKLAEFLREKLQAIKELYENSDNFKEVKMCMELYRLFMILGNDLLNTSLPVLSEKVSRRNQITGRMISVCSYLSSHCTEEISLDEAAEYAGFSKSHFSRLFKEFTAGSYPDFITKERLRKAEELLTNSTLSVTEAAFQAGFNSISTFNRTFRQHKNCSPTEFRDLYRVSHTQV